MSTSGSTNYATSRDTIISGALRIIGAIAQGETPTANQVTEAAEALNLMVKAWSADGMPLWAIKEYSVPMTVSTTSYRIGLNQTINIPKPLKVIQAYFHVGSSGIDVPMTQLTRIDYNMLGNKASTGQPIQFFYDPQSNYGDLFVYPTPDSTAATAGNYVKIVYQRPFEDFDTSTDEPDFPQEWYDAIKFGLADRLAPEYGISIQERQEIKARSKELKNEVLGFGTEEGNFHFQADIRNY